MKFNTTHTQGGYKILSIHGPSSCGSYYGTVQDDTGAFFTCTWESDGRDNDYPNARGFDLIPLADEPEPSETTELWNEIEALREITVETLKRMNEMRTDYIARINGLRSDYLADQSAVQPSRVDALEDRLDNLVAHHKLTESFAADIWQRLDKFDDELGVLQDDVNLDLRLELRDLTKRLEALEQRTQTDEKGVWVTRESLKRAFDATQEFLIRNDRFKEIAERLGLEEREMKYRIVKNGLGET